MNRPPLGCGGQGRQSRAVAGGKLRFRTTSAGTSRAATPPPPAASMHACLFAGLAPCHASTLQAIYTCTTHMRSTPRMKTLNHMHSVTRSGWLPQALLPARCHHTLLARPPRRSQLQPAPLLPPRLLHQLHHAPLAPPRPAAPLLQARHGAGQPPRPRSRPAAHPWAPAGPWSAARGCAVWRSSSGKWLR